MLTIVVCKYFIIHILKDRKKWAYVYYIFLHYTTLLNAFQMPKCVRVLIKRFLKCIENEIISWYTNRERNGRVADILLNIKYIWLCML